MQVSASAYGWVWGQNTMLDTVKSANKKSRRKLQPAFGLNVWLVKLQGGYIFRLWALLTTDFGEAYTLAFS
jgi:hypothetical protein